MGEPEFITQQRDWTRTVLDFTTADYGGGEPLRVSELHARLVLGRLGIDPGMSFGELQRCLNREADATDG